MTIFTKEQLKRLKKFEPYFTSLSKYGYVRDMSTTLVDEITAIYAEAEPNMKMNINKSCSTCVANLLRKTYADYKNSIKISKEKKNA